MPIIAQNVPPELRRKRQWVLWRYVDKGGPKPTKVPCQTDGKPAAVNDPATWTTFDAALGAAKRFDGIGFVLTPDLGIVGFDLDNCVDDAGNVQPWAASIVARLDTYCEISPSNHGLRLLAYGKLPPSGRKHGGFECYQSGRYLTVTGNVPGDPKPIAERQSSIDAIHAEQFAKATATRPSASAGPRLPVSLDDAALLAKARAAENGESFRRLWDGDTSGYASHSEADQALCSKLAFWTGGDAARVDRLFRQCGLMRDKWDEQRGAARYGEVTIGKALEGLRDTYTPSPTYSNGHAPQVRKATVATPGDMAPEAFYGVTGEVVQALDPHTESGKPAILLSFLVAVGNAIGRGPHAVAEADRHGTNLFAVLVGDTAKGRKGSSWGHIRELFSRVDEPWTNTRILGGLSSGEGLVWAVRDPIETVEAVKEHGKPTGEVQSVLVDAGVDDKRLLAMEPEFASVLRVMIRESNILSSQVRQAWDSGLLRTMTKNNPAKATNAHISIIGHVTKEELLRYLTDTEAGNGFANRFLWVYTRRSKVLPEGGGEPSYQRLVPMLHEALERARRVGRLARDAEAKEAWAAIYEDLSEGKPGLFGSVTARAEAQVLRLSGLYAALDGDTAIRLPHLRAALAVWEYCAASARYIFGDATGDPIADQILAALVHGELNRTAISNLLGRHASSERITQALQLLLNAKLVRVERRDSEGGRPGEVWSRV